MLKMFRQSRDSLASLEFALRDAEVLSTRNIERSIMIWRCPRCQSNLIAQEHSLQCASCNSGYEVIDGIPDLRVDVDSWIDFQKDLDFARTLATADLTLEQMIRAVYSARPDWDAARITRRTREVLAGPSQMSEQVAGWLAHPTSDGPILDLGCGNGPMVVALLSAGRKCIGIDVSMTWLIVAQRMVRDAGYVPVLAAAVAEALPLENETLGSVVSLDVLEHVRDVPRYVREIDRVVRPGGFVALSTPNRYSLSAEPHVFVWGVGWIPRRWQKQFVRWRSGRTYDDTVLRSHAELMALIKRNSAFAASTIIPRIQTRHIRNSSKPKAAIANLYNWLVGLPGTRIVFRVVGPFFQIVGVKA